MAPKLTNQLSACGIILLGGMVSNTSPAVAWGGLVRQWVQGMNTVCAYSDGEQYMMDGLAMCPVSDQEAQPQGFSQHGMGMSAGEYQDNNSKVCVYEVFGERKFLRLDSTSLCPLSYQF